MARIVLASGSPRRQELLRRIGIEDFDVRVPETAETYPAGLDPRRPWSTSPGRSPTPPRRCARRTRSSSPRTPWCSWTSSGWASPPGEADALRMLTALQGRHHTVCTGVTVRQGPRILTESESTDVYFRPASEAELRAYIRTGEPMDKAGAYGVQGKGALLVERAGRRLLQRDGPAGAAAEPDAGAVRRAASELTPESGRDLL